MFIPYQDIPSEHATSAKLEIAVQTLQDILKFGHSHGHGRGFTCANKAKAALEQIGIAPTK